MGSIEGENQTELPLDFLKPAVNAPGSPTATWFASSVAALQRSRGAPSDYPVPASLLRAARTSIVPRGLLIYFDLAPALCATDTARGWEVLWLAKVRKLRHRGRKDFGSARNAAWMRENELRNEFQFEWEESRVARALASTWLTSSVIAEANGKWLLGCGLSWSAEVVRVVEEAIYWMTCGSENALALADMLERWKKWTEVGMMFEGDVEYIAKHRLEFSYASALLSLLSES